MDTVKGDAIHSRPGLYPVRNKVVREVFDTLETAFQNELPNVIADAQAAPNESVRADILDEFTASCIRHVLEAMRQLQVDLV